MSDEIIPTKETPGPYDALAKAAPSEPVFTLIGRDEFAPPTILHWVDLTRKSAMRMDNRDAAKRLLDKATDAEMIAWAMTQWRKDQPDPSSESLPFDYYSGAGSKEMDAASNAHRVRIDACRKIDNAVAVMTDVAKALRKIDFVAYAAELELAVAQLQDTSAGIRPTRTN